MSNKMQAVLAQLNFPVIDEPYTPIKFHDHFVNGTLGNKVNYTIFFPPVFSVRINPEQVAMIVKALHHYNSTVEIMQPKDEVLGTDSKQLAELFEGLEYTVQDYDTINSFVI